MAKAKVSGYLKGSERIGGTGIVTDFQGKKIGTYVVTSKWKTPKSYVSSTMLQVDARIDGNTYTGRSAGNNMLFNGKLKTGR